MSKDLVDWSRCFAEKDPLDGITKIYDMHTGHVVAVENVRADGTRDLVPTSFDAPLPIYSMQYSRPFAEVICQRIVDGAILKTLCNEPGMPKYAVICRWSAQYPEFKEMLATAERHRAEGMTDEALEVARELHERDYKKLADIQAATLLTNQLWQKAGAGSAKFQPKAKADAPTNVAIQVVIETGIRRQGDPGFRVDETEKIKNARDVSPAPKEEPNFQDITPMRGPGSDVE